VISKSSSASTSVVGVRHRHGAIGLAAERCHFDDLILKDDVHEPEAAANDAAVAEEPAHVARMRVGDDVEVFRRAPHQQIAHAAAAQVRAVAAAMQAVQDFEDVLRNAAARDGVIAAIDDVPFGRRRDFRRLDFQGLRHGRRLVMITRFHRSSRRACSGTCCRR
jgi:hypothetical protein